MFGVVTVRAMLLASCAAFFLGRLSDRMWIGSVSAFNG